MALKTIMLRHGIERKKQQLEELRKKDADFDTREAELEAAIKEANTEEEQTAVGEAVEEFDTEKQAHENAKKTLSTEIAGLEKDLGEAEKMEPDLRSARHDNHNERSNHMETKINIRALPMSVRAVDAMPMEQRAAMMQREDVKAFLAGLRGMKGQSRAVSGGELTIPVIMLDMISENLYRYSKLLNRVRVRDVYGQARQTVAGTVPEAVWTEMCAAINELTFNFNQVTLDGYKVAGFVPVCNSLLEDNDINLASWIVEMLSESVGLAIDKAILYGKGAANKMPLGIVTRLAQQSKPSDYPASAPAWTDLHTTNVLQIDSGKTGADFWANLQIAAGNTFTRYSRGEQFWAMNSKTYALLKSKAITFTATGNVVANVYDALPVVNGNIDILEFMPDGDIVGGYGDLYLYSQRAGISVESSREVQFIQDNTVFKAKARGDGQPVIPGAFVAINIKGTAVTTSMNFAADKANDADLEDITGLTLTPAFDPGKTAYTATMSAAAVVSAVAANESAVVTMTYNGKNMVNGTELTPASGSKDLVVTVKNGNASKVYTVTITKS
nr:MAG TPA: major capsid protein [Caudoviricetes sp.]